MICWSHEPTLTQILSDPITEAVMRADSVDAGELETLLRDVASKLASGRGSAEPLPVR
jgi:hypothetical protein